MKIVLISDRVVHISYLEIYIKESVLYEQIQ